MFKYRILICDDEERKVVLLREALGEQRYDVVHVKSVEDLLFRLDKEQPPDAVFLDLYFKTGETFSILDRPDVAEVRSALGKAGKLLIYTQHTGDEIDLLRELSLDGTIDWWIRKEELDDKESIPSTVLRIERILEMRNEVREGFWLIHLSDLHFGRQFVDIDRTVGNSLVRHISKKIEKPPMGIGEDEYRSPNVCVISGDATQEANEDEFKNAKTFVDDLLREMEDQGSYRPIVLMCPGNHDLPWRKTIQCEHNAIYDKSERVAALSDDKVDDDKMHEIKWKDYSEAFAEHIESLNLIHSESRWWVGDLSARFGIMVYVVNSAFYITYKDNAARMPSDWIDEMRKASGKSALPGILIVHHPVANWSDSEENRDALLERLHSELSIKIIFSGHKHKGKMIPHRTGGGDLIYEVQTGSAAVDKSEIGEWLLPQFRVVRVGRNRDGEISDINSWAFEYRKEKGTYVIAPASDEEVFEKAVF